MQDSEGPEPKTATKDIDTSFKFELETIKHLMVLLEDLPHNARHRVLEYVIKRLDADRERGSRQESLSMQREMEMEMEMMRKVQAQQNSSQLVNKAPRSFA